MLELRALAGELGADETVYLVEPRFGLVAVALVRQRNGQPAGRLGPIRSLWAARERLAEERLGSPRVPGPDISGPERVGGPESLNASLSFDAASYPRCCPICTNLSASMVGTG